MSKLGIECVVVSPADIPTTNKEKLSKTDSLDSRKLAKELELGRLTSIHIPSLEAQTVRSLCRLRRSFVKDSTRQKNRIKSFLNLYGYDLDIKPYWSGAMIQQLEKASQNLPGGETLKSLIIMLKATREQISSCTIDLRRVLNKMKKNNALQLLMTVPGIGFIAASTLLCEIIDINRFSSFDHLASFVGLIPTMADSGDKETHRTMTSRGNTVLNHMLIEAAWVAIRKDPVMLKKYNDLSRRMKKQKAIVRVAKKLLNRIYSVWKNKQPYVLSQV